MKYISLAIILIIAAVFCITQVSAYRYSVFAVNESGTPLKNAKVSVYWNGQTLIKQMITQEGGRTRPVTLLYGYYLIRVCHFDYNGCTQKYMTMDKNIELDRFKLLGKKK